MASTRFFLDTRKSKEQNKPKVLKIAIAHKKKTSYISLSIKLREKEWDSIKSRVVNHPDKLTLNTYINRIKSTIDSLILRLTNEGVLKDSSASDIKNMCLDFLCPERAEKSIDKTSFLYRFTRYSERMKAGTRRTFEHTLNRLHAYVGDSQLSKLKFEDITVDWLTQFDKFMSATSPSKNSRNIHFRNIRTVFNEAIEDGITTHYPFRRFKIKVELTAKRDLTVEELRRLIYYDCEACAVKYRDYFILMFYLMGINNIDLCHLKEIKKGRIEFHRTKTRHFFSMKIEPEALTLIKKYKGKDWLLDIMDHWSSDTYFRKKMNKHLQRIGPIKRHGRGGKKEYQPMFPKLTTYYARHTWASIASSLDIPIETISAGLGHEYGNPITRLYIHYDTKKIDDANRKIIDWVLYGKKDGEQKVSPGTAEFFGLNKNEATSLGLI